MRICEPYPKYILLSCGAYSLHFLSILHMNVFCLNLSPHYRHCHPILNLSSENVFLLRIHDTYHTLQQNSLIFIVTISHFKINSYLAFLVFLNGQKTLHKHFVTPIILCLLTQAKSWLKYTKPRLQRAYFCASNSSLKAGYSAVHFNY